MVLLQLGGAHKPLGYPVYGQLSSKTMQVTNNANKNNNKASIATIFLHLLHVFFLYVHIID